MFYHTLVTRATLRNFQRVNARDYEGILAGYFDYRDRADDARDNIKHRFSGDHALGGERNDKESLQRWFDRLRECGPGLKVDVRDVWVKGWPWDTTIVVRWDASGAYPTGEPYANHGVHIVQMRWFTVYRIDVHEDSQAVARMLKARFESGIKAAGEPPIVS